MAREDSEFVIVGAGLLGLATAAALTRRGRQVTVLEQATAGHPGAGSKGSCRIFRLGYPDPPYVALARQARDFWTELEQAQRTQLLTPAPQLTFGTELGHVHQAMRAVGARCELLPAAEAGRWFPAVRVPGPVLHEPDSSVINASAALGSLGGALPDLREHTRVTAIQDDGRRVTVSSHDERLACRAVIVTAGPWTARLLGPVGISLPAAATQEQAGYLDLPGAVLPAPAVRPDLPILIEHGAGHVFYGLPVPGAPLYKTGLHHGGPATDPDQQDQDPDPDLAGQLAGFVRRRLPGLPADPVSYERCVYDNTPDEDFVIGRIGNVVIGSGTSGHGFKFGPLLGDWLAALATQKLDTAEPAALASQHPELANRFSPRRFTG
jgi:sarcosine oxidase